MKKKVTLTMDKQDYQLLKSISEDTGIPVVRLLRTLIHYANNKYSQDRAFLLELLEAQNNERDGEKH